MRTRDETTRAEMLQMVKDCWPAGEALAEAMEKEAHFWRMLDESVAAPEAEATFERKRRQDARSPSQQRTKGGKRDASSSAKRRIMIGAKGVKYCGAWNSTRGCTHNEKQCPQRARHACCAQTAKSVACCRRDHTYLGH